MPKERNSFRLVRRAISWSLSSSMLRSISISLVYIGNYLLIDDVGKSVYDTCIAQYPFLITYNQET